MENTTHNQQYREPTETPTLGELFKALSKAQGQMGSAKKDGKNSFTKSSYSTIDSMLAASREALTLNGLCVIQRILPNGGQVSYLHTRLCHASGEWIESKLPIAAPANDIQKIGSYITYLRRYTYASIIGLVLGDEQDDDGEAAMGRRSPARREEAQEEEAPKVTKISYDQLKVLAKELEDEQEILDDILDKMNISKLADVPPAKYDALLLHVRKVKSSVKESKNDIV